MAKVKKRNTAVEKRSYAGYFLVLVFVVIIPLLHSKSIVEPVVYPRFTAIAISLFILCVLVWLERKRLIDLGFLKKNFFLVYLLFIIITTVSLFVAVNPIEGLTDLLKWILLFIFVTLVAFILNSFPRTMELLLKAVVINALLASTIGIYQYFTNAFQNPDPNALYEVKGLMAHKNQFSISIFLLLPFIINAILSFKGIWRSFAIVALIFSGINILMLQTRAVWIAILFTGLIGLIILAFLNKRYSFLTIRNKSVKKTLIVAFVVFVLAIVSGVVIPVNNPVKQITNRISTVFNPDYTSNQWRLEIWDSTLDLIKDNPIIGVGAGNWKINIYPYYSEHLPSVFRHWRNPHNDYLSILSEKGILGFIFYLLIFLILIYYSIDHIIKLKDKRKNLSATVWLLGIVGYLIVSFFSFPNDRPNHWIFISLLMAIILVDQFNVKEHKRNENLLTPIKFLIVVSLAITSYAVYFGIKAIISEVNIAKVITAKEKKDWDKVGYFAEKANYYFAPIEPSSSFPISQYQGLAEYNKGNFVDALGHFKKAYAKHPTSISVINNLGSVYGQMGQMDSSIVFHKKSLEIFPHYETSLMNLTRAYYIMEDYEKAYQVVLSCDPKSENEQVKNARVAIEAKLDQ